MYWRFAADLPCYGRSVAGDGRHEVPVWAGVERPRAGREGVGAGGGLEVGGWLTVLRPEFWSGRYATGGT